MTTSFSWEGKTYDVRPEVTADGQIGPDGIRNACRGCSFVGSTICRTVAAHAETFQQACGEKDVVYVEQTPEAQAAYAAARLGI